MGKFEQDLIDAVLNQIIKDLHEGDLTALEGLLRFIPADILGAYLPEDTWELLKADWQIKD